MPIQVVTIDVRYIHELSLTLEHSMSISSPAAPGLTATTILLEALQKLCLDVFFKKQVCLAQILAELLDHSRDDVVIVDLRGTRLL